MIFRQAREPRDRKPGPQEKIFDGDRRPDPEPAPILQ
jgi:hypothetical protein